MCHHKVDVIIHHSYTSNVTLLISNPLLWSSALNLEHDKTLLDFRFMGRKIDILFLYNLVPISFHLLVTSKV